MLVGFTQMSHCLLQPDYHNKLYTWCTIHVVALLANSIFYVEVGQLYCSQKASPDCTLRGVVSRDALRIWTT